MDRTDDGRPLKLMTVVDEYSRECLAIVVARRIRATDVLDVFADLMAVHGVPEHLRSDYGPEMIAQTLRRWLARVGARTLYRLPAASPGDLAYAAASRGAGGSADGGIK